MSAVIDTSPRPAGRCALGTGAPARVIAHAGGRDITLSTFHAQVRALAAQLPAGQHAVNLCEDRYRFMVALCAVALRGQVTLLPPSRAPAVVDDVMARQPATYAIGDEALHPAPAHYWRMPDVLGEADGEVPEIDEDAVMAVAFTSGSTGAPKAFPKTLAQFRTSTAQLVASMAELWDGRAPSIVATVPAQHMFGLEQSVMVPLLAEATAHGGRPFFPQDVARALAQMPAPRMLITTPVHLRALIESGIALPAIAGCVSATAPLEQALACQAEARFGGQVREIFGSTETCIFATRRTAMESAWTPLPGVSVQPQPDGTLIDAPHLSAPVVLADLMEVDAEGRFHLRGRQADLLEIAGKRASLGDLTRRLLAVPGVRDGVMVQIDRPGKVRRIAALVVALGLSESDVLSSLREAMDPVFLPRKIRFVDTLPRTDTGKLPRADLMRLLGETT
ncbi:Acyl-coenzyme A synthetase/AMP-(fatty) acid ligase [Pseudoxanthomonas sp. GM95]|uniref:AMP-binding protein n=1 Tax=Pseudoxanthomonas sp. GM95 TaxID=1881043 RepID=UPI0008C2391B|nr:AMP-binding protein [Pseudoxanthomonas sp. GM95]SEM39907.1 Acyl-coenzyme A synthetase/AMP-(fatty) acid ligase [Pseudoxanthomonas sp. GM95]